MSFRAAGSSFRLHDDSARSREGRQRAPEAVLWPFRRRRSPTTTTQRSFYFYRIDALGKGDRAAQAANNAGASG
jgi:hypothetical protein